MRSCSDVSGVRSSCEASEMSESRSPMACLRSSLADPRMSVVAATMTMNACKCRRLSDSVAIWNGPQPATVPAIAMVETTKFARAAPRTPNRRPAHIEERKDEISLAQHRRVEVFAQPEDEKVGGHEEQTQRHRFPEPWMRRAVFQCVATRRHAEQQRDHDEVAHGVSDPPCAPCLERARARDDPSEPQAGQPDRGADPRARDGREPDEHEHVSHATERRVAAGQPLHRPGAGEGLERIAHRDSAGHRGRSTDTEVA